MGEHRANRTAIIRAMLPSFPTGHDYTNVSLRGGFSLRQGLLIIAPERIRKTESGVEVLIKLGEKEEWAGPPEGAEVIPEGEKLGHEHLDYVVTLMGSKVDATLVVGRNGGHPMTLAPLQEVLRIPAVDFLARFDGGRAANGAGGLIVGG